MSLRLLTSSTVLVLALSLLSACDKANTDHGLQGYVEGEYLYLAAPQSGYLKTLVATRGSRVLVGQAVFALDTEPDQQALAEAEARADSARGKLLNPARAAPTFGNCRAGGESTRCGSRFAFKRIATGSAGIFTG